MSQGQQVDFNIRVSLVKRPTWEFPNKDEGIFQVKYLPPTPIDQLKDGQVVVRNQYLAIGASMRVSISGVKTYAQPINLGDAMRGPAVSEIIYSKNPKFQIGDRVLGVSYWQKYSILDGKQLSKIPKDYPNPADFLGVLGNSGLTAYFGLKKIGNLKAGQTVVVSAAAGGVGEIAVQLAKIAGCKVCAIVGSDEKCQYLRSLGVDHTINYKKQALRTKLKEVFPEGVDVYFDNVGGQMLDDVLQFIRNQSRIIACGSISTYGYLSKNKGDPPPYKLKNYSRIIIKRALIQGFLYFDYAEEFPAAIQELRKYIAEGKIKYRVDYLNGLEECPTGLKRLLKGENNGKVVIKVNNELLGKANL